MFLRDDYSQILFRDERYSKLYLGGELIFVDTSDYLVFDQMNRYADGQVPTLSMTGHTWGQFSGPGYVTNGLYDSEPGTGASYIETNTNAEINYMEGRFMFDSMGGTRTGTGCTLCLVSWADGGIVANGFGRRTRAHVVVTPTGVSYFVRDVLGNNISVTNIRNWGFTAPLNFNEFYEMQVSISGTTATVTVSNGFVGSITDSRIGPRDGETFACFEPFYNNESIDARVRVDSVGFKGVPIVAPPLPSLAFVNQGTDTRSSTTAPMTFVMPQMNGGDLILLAANMATTTTAFTVSGLDFTQLNTNNSRTGASSGIFYRAASGSVGQPSPDSGTTVSVTASSNLLMTGAFIVVRGVKSAPTAFVKTNAGSASPVNLVVGAFTPSETTIPVTVLAPVKAQPVVATFSPPSGYTEVSSVDPTAGIQTGVSWALNITPGESVGTVWTNTTTPNSHYYTGWTITLEKS